MLTVEPTTSPTHSSTKFWTRTKRPLSGPSSVPAERAMRIFSLLHGFVVEGGLASEAACGEIGETTAPLYLGGHVYEMTKRPGPRDPLGGVRLSLRGGRSLAHNI